MSEARRAVEAVWRMESARIVGALARYTRDFALAEDVAQEALQRVLRGLDTFDERRPLEPWVRRIAVNRALDELRRDRRLVRTQPEAADTGPLWSDDAREEDLVLAKAVAGLAAENRVVVVLHYWLDYSAQEVADVLGLPIGTVSSRLSRARAELRAALEDEEEEEHAA